MGEPAGAAIGAICKPIADDTYAYIKRHLNYLCCFKNNVQTLEDKARTLEAERETLQRTVDDARRDGLEIRADVDKWLEDTIKCQADKMKVEDAFRHVQNGCCLNIILRHSVGSQANKTAEDMEKLRKDNTFGNNVALPPKPAAAVPFAVESNKLQCRKQMEDRIVDALKRPDVNIVGIWGIGGSGKTFTAKNVVNRMKTGEQLVHEHVMVVVSQGGKVLDIQQNIAAFVGLQLDSDIELARAHQLRTRLESPGRKIIVVDDIWEHLNFEEIGIPCRSDSGGCKILLTSRDKRVLHQMGVLNQNCFLIDTLTEEDAWSLFRDKAGTCVDDTNLKPIAEQVLAECKGLPLAIEIVGAALKYQGRKGIWEDALHQLKRAAPTNIDGVIERVYKPLRLSYDRLDSEDQTSLFLLCCIFPEDFEISLEDLTLYGMGLNMFEGVCTLSQARNRVLFLVEKLKGCALLLDGKDEKHVKMHDVVRDVARFIAREKRLIDEQPGLKGRSHGNCEWAFTRETAKDSYYKIGSDFQCLRLLVIRYEYINWDLHMYDDSLRPYMNINGFPSVGGMQELEVLSLQRISWELADCRLKNLKTLELIRCCPLKNLSFVGQLMGLEILKCNECSEVEELPIEIGNLERLKLLDLSDCKNLKTIRVGIISKLNVLEELMMLGSFKEWESTKIINGEDVKHNACLKELESLKRLTCLKIEIANIELVNENMSLSESIIKYHIQIGRHKLFHEDKVMPSYPCLLTKHNDCFRSWIHKFVSAAEEIHLNGDSSRKIIPSDSFESMVKTLVISDCKKMEEVFLIEKREQVGNKGNLTFSKLVKMEIREMPNLIAFIKEIESIEFPSLTKLHLKACPKFKWIGFQDDCNHDEDSLHYFCNGKVMLEILQELTIIEYNARSLWCQRISPQFFGALKKLTIKECPNVTIFCSFLIAKNLKELSINSCRHMEYMIGVEKQTHHSFTRYSDSQNEGGGRIQPFPNLKILKFEFLNTFKNLSEGTETFKLHMLHSLTIVYCPKFKEIDQNQTDGCSNDSLHLFCGKQLPYSSSSLRVLFIQGYVGYDNVSNLWCQRIPSCFFQSLETLNISSSHKLRSAFPYSVAKHLLNLKYLYILDCKQMEFVASGLENEIHEQNSMLFPSLVSLSLSSVPSLEMFCEWGCSLTLPSLEYISFDLVTIFRKSTNERVEDWNNFLRQHIMSRREQEEERRRKKKEEEEEEKRKKKEEEKRSRRIIKVRRRAKTSEQSSTPILEAPINEELRKDELQVDAVPSLSRQEFGSVTAFEVQPTTVLEQAESFTAAAERSATMDQTTAEIT